MDSLLSRPRRRRWRLPCPLKWLAWFSLSDRSIPRRGDFFLSCSNHSNTFIWSAECFSYMQKAPRFMYIVWLRDLSDPAYNASIQCSWLWSPAYKPCGMWSHKWLVQEQRSLNSLLTDMVQQIKNPGLRDYKGKKRETGREGMWEERLCVIKIITWDCERAPLCLRTRAHGPRLCSDDPSLLTASYHRSPLPPHKTEQESSTEAPASLSRLSYCCSPFRLSFSCSPHPLLHPFSLLLSPSTLLNQSFRADLEFIGPPVALSLLLPPFLTPPPRPCFLFLRFFNKKLLSVTTLPALRPEPDLRLYNPKLYNIFQDTTEEEQESRPPTERGRDSRDRKTAAAKTRASKQARNPQRKGVGAGKESVKDEDLPHHSGRPECAPVGGGSPFHRWPPVTDTV
jgi:hypothetical protein